MDAVNLPDCLNAAREAARRAAEVLEHWRKRFRISTKGRHDFVTDADLESQRTVREYLGQRFPSYGLLAEEGDAAKYRPGGDAAPTWIVDPLDGTTNYVHDCPLYCVSIGLEAAGQLVVGVILDPSRGEVFSAARSLGAWLNDQRLHTSEAASLDNALLATGFPADMRGHEYTLDWWRYFSTRTRSLRRTGSTALNLAYVAAGRFDGFWAFDNKPWDVAAGAVLIREAGGIITNVDGSPFNPYMPDAVASNGPLQPVLLEHLRRDPRAVI
jgi:myo-inositol-1(or 4)-monophosphatase